MSQLQVRQCLFPHFHSAPKVRERLCYPQLYIESPDRIVLGVPPPSPPLPSVSTPLEKWRVVGLLFKAVSPFTYLFSPRTSLAVAQAPLGLVSPDTSRFFRRGPSPSGFGGRFRGAPFH